MYNIDDTVWHASRDSTEKRITCPECFGKKYLTVILGDDSQVTINCAGCARGYDPPEGYVTYWEQDINVRQVTICKVEVYLDHIEYGFGGSERRHYKAKDTDFFNTKIEAEIRAQELVKEWNKEQLAKIHRKAKNNHTWSWHVYYYRKRIRDAKNTIEYAEKQLDAAKTHVKKEA